MSKFTLLTFQKSKNKLLERLQLFENIHFKKLTQEDFFETKCFKLDSTNEEESSYQKNLGKLNFVLQTLLPFEEELKLMEKLKQEPKELSYREFENFSTTYEFDPIYDELRETDEFIKKLEQEINSYEILNVTNKYWEKLDISTKSLDKLKHVNYLMGSINKNAMEDFVYNLEKKFSTCYVELIDTNKDDALILLIFNKSMMDEMLGFLREEGFSRSILNFEDSPIELIRKNNDAIKENKIKIAELIEGNKKYVKEIPNIKTTIDYYESLYERTRTKKMFLATDKVAIIDGWVPDDLQDDFVNIIDDVLNNEYHLEFTEVDTFDEEVPIKLKNGKIVSSFESIISMFGTPMYHELDPTPFMAPFYILFFGIMTGDFGYGLLLMLGTLFALKALKLDESKKGFLSFLFYCSFGAIFAGILFGSFFGMTFFAPIQYMDANGVAGFKPILDSEIDLMFMLLLSVVIGGVQIFFGVFLKGVTLVKNGKILDALFDSLLIILTLASVILTLVTSMGMIDSPVLGKISLYVFIGCLVGVALTQGRGNATTVGKIAGGLYEVYGLTGYIGDFVSYTRLVALCLSGSYVALSFNQMVGSMTGITKLLAGTVVLILAHAMNIGLTLLSAYVHSSRLQYVEYFGKFFDGGGVPFKPFKLRNKYIVVKDNDNKQN